MKERVKNEKTSLTNESSCFGQLADSAPWCGNKKAGGAGANGSPYLQNNRPNCLTEFILYLPMNEPRCGSKQPSMLITAVELPYSL